MLRIYNYQGNRLSLCEEQAAGSPQPLPVWIDLVSPTPQETREAEAQIGVKLPSRDEMEEIELSDRLYHEDGAEFMTVTVLAQIETQNPIKTPVTFVLKRGTLIKSIRLTGDAQEIDCKFGGIKGLVLRAEFVRKR